MVKNRFDIVVTEHGGHSSASEADTSLPGVWAWERAMPNGGRQISDESVEPDG
jgi:hypothetical protein